MSRMSAMRVIGVSKSGTRVGVLWDMHCSDGNTLSGRASASGGMNGFFEGIVQRIDRGRFRWDPLLRIICTQVASRNSKEGRIRTNLGRSFSESNVSAGPCLTCTVTHARDDD
jgi:hypothetical protein